MRIVVRRLSYVVLGVLAAAAISGCKKKKPAPPPEKPAATKPAPAKPAVQAHAVIQSKSGSKVTGSAVFTATGEQVNLVLLIQGATPGMHASHLHQKGDCSSPDGKSAGGHWNPSKEKHGKWGVAPHHFGDIGNINVGADGKGSISLTTNKWSIGTGKPNDVVGKAIIVHIKADDFKTQPTGGAGGRVGCGVVKKM